MLRRQVWLAELDPVRGSEQAGTRPVVLVQNDIVSVRFPTRLVVPFTGNLRWRHLPYCVFVTAGEGGLLQDSLALCFQARACDQSRLIDLMGQLTAVTMAKIEVALRATLKL